MTSLRERVCWHDVFFPWNIRLKHGIKNIVKNNVEKFWLNLTNPQNKSFSKLDHNIFIVQYVYKANFPIG
jgi:hypothetical protein